MYKYHIIKHSYETQCVAVLHVIYGRALVDLRQNHDAYTDEFIVSSARTVGVVARCVDVIEVV